MSDEPWIDPRNIAAIVYDDGVAVDSLLSVFAADLVAAGTRIGGVIHVPRSEPGCGPKSLMKLTDLATGELIALCRTISVQQCALDPAGLELAAERVRTAGQDDAELVFLSRFGRQETAGRGYTDALGQAVRSGRPVLTAVRRGLVDNWLSAAGGVGTLLEARLWVLKDWWQEVHRRASATVV